MPEIRKSVEVRSSLNAHGSNRFTRACAGVLPALALIVTAQFGGSEAGAQVNVTTYHNDIGRTGQNLSETTLNLSNVNANLFGKLFSQPVDGLVYAQPLYLSGVTIGGATHNVVYVATEHDSVYAFDADSNGGIDASPLWKASMLTTAHGAASGATTVSSNIVSTDITPEVGITGTPVIDPATGTLYVVSKTMESGTAIQRLHALDVTSGAEKFGGPVVITATVAGTGNGSVSGSLTFDSLWENQRPGLLLLNGIVYVGFAAHGDNGPWHGWIIGYNASTLARAGAYCASPNGTGSGFWMSGDGLAADQLDPVNKPFGRMFVATGNGDYNATKPYTNSMDYGDSHLALDLTNGQPTITDEFTTNQQATLNSQDGDVGSGGLIVLPPQSGTNPHLAVQAGKGGTLYLLNRDNMGGYNTTADQVLQEQAYMVGNVGVWSTPAYFNGTVYYWGRFDYLKAFPLVNGLLSTTPTKSTEQYGYPGATPSISANGTSQGIVWTIDAENYGNPGPAILQAHSAANVSTTLYSSATNAARDTAGNAVKFTVPTIANGKVYVGASGEIDIYGLLNGVTQTAAPVITPGTESYSGTVTVTITDSTPGAAIYYTTDNSSATTSSTLYTGPFTVSSTETINAIASATGLLLSAQTSATYTNVSQANAPVFSLPTGTYGAAQSVTLSDATAGASIYYTTDGSTPTTSSTLYTGAITVSSTETITVVAVASGLSNSPIIAQTYTIQLGATGISYPQGFAASTGQIILNGSAQLNDSRLQLTNGLSGENAAAWYKTPVNIQTFTNDFTFQLSNPGADGYTFAIQNGPQTINSMGGNTYQLGYAPIPNSIAVKFSLYNSTTSVSESATGLYVNGANPTTPEIDLAGTGIDLHSDDAMAVHMTYDGTTLTMKITDMVTSAVWATSWTISIPSTIGSNTAYVGFTGSTGALSASQKILTWSFISSAPSTTAAATPTFSPAAGTYTSAQTVTISDTTSGAKIYYTTDGTAPTSSSTLYSAPIAVSSTKTVKAIAIASGFSNSAIGSAAYTINLPAATPTFSPAGGSYTSTQSVTISDTTTGATIYYTTDGTTPTTSSAVYSAPISVASTETVKAIAVASGFSTSATASAAYTINTSTQVATPVLGLAGGVYYTTQTVSISDSTAGATIYWTWDGTTPTTSSTVYSGPISIGQVRTIKAIAVASGLTTSSVASATYSLTVATPTLSLASGTYAGAQTLTISSTTPNATLFYTTNGSTPGSGSSQYTAPLTVSASEQVKVVGARTGWLSSPVVSASYTITGGTSTPVFSPAGGTYTTAQSVTISDATSGAAIYYTTDGTTPTTSSTVYSGPVTVGTSETLKAIAVASGVSSTVGSAAYTIAPLAATPAFSVAAGTYTSAQSVAITDSTAGATIYYTTNGTTPTTASAVYSGAISVSTTETLKAIAVATGFTASNVASATYTISSTAPVVNFPSSFTATGLSLNNATITGGKLQLTDGGAGEARAAWYATPINIQKFTTDFNFQAASATADGFAFVIQGSPKGVWALGGNGYALGYGGIANSVAAKFDLYSNSGEGSDSTGFYVNGASPTLPSVDMTGSGVDLHSGDIMHAHITYDGTTLTLTITDTATSAAFTTSTAINIPSTVGANTALVGFTGGTGGLTAIQNILNWTYTVN